MIVQNTGLQGHRPFAPVTNTELSNPSMARILAISSFVSHGHVGLAAMTPVLQALGHEVVGVPTVVLSNHRGYEACGGFALSARQLGEILQGLKSNGWLEDIDAVVSGYVADAGQAELIAATIERMAEAGNDFLYVCDPVLGDDPKGLYVPEELAASVRDDLVPLADFVTPNRFELGWLTGAEVLDADGADAACEMLDVDIVVATSIPAGEGRIANLFSDSETALTAVGRRYEGVPNGTGDVLAALFLGHVLNDVDETEAFAMAASGTNLVIEASLGAEELRLVPNLRAAVAAEPAALDELE